MPQPEEDQSKPAPLPDNMLDALVPHKVNGKMEMLPVREVLARSQKATALETGFEELAAAKKKVEASDLIRDGILMKDPARIRKGFQQLDFNDQQIEQLFDPPSQPAEQDSPPRNRRVVRDEEEDEEDPRYQQIQEEMQTMRKSLEVLLGAFENAKQTASQRQRDNVVYSAIDADPELATMLKGLDEETRTWIRDQAKALVLEASEAIPWGPRAVQTGLAKAKKRFQPLLARRTEDDGTLEDSDDLTPSGLGPSGRTAGRLHQTTSNDRASVLDVGYKDSVMKRLAKYLRS